MSKRFVIIILVLIAVFGGIFFVNKNKSSAPGSSSGNTQPTNHVKGNGAKNVTLLEYGDFQCPACGIYYPWVGQLYDKYQNDITFQFRHYPLTQIHKNAFIASRAAEAASKQNKFWEMYDVLYQNQNSWKESNEAATIFAGYAQQLGLNVDQFKTDMMSEEVNNLINADLKAGQELGINSTPTFYINGKKVEDNPTSYEAFEKLITDAIAAQSKQ